MARLDDLRVVRLQTSSASCLKFFYFDLEFLKGDPSSKTFNKKDPSYRSPNSSEEAYMEIFLPIGWCIFSSMKKSAKVMRKPSSKPF
jgi:hypothetical protein